MSFSHLNEMFLKGKKNKVDIRDVNKVLHEIEMEKNIRYMNKKSFIHTRPFEQNLAKSNKLISQSKFKFIKF